VEHSVIVSCTPDVAFRLYTDHSVWRNRSVFDDLRWIEGEPWKQGSRMEVYLNYPVRFAVNEVVVRYKPNEQVSLISHGMGITVEHNMYFEKQWEGGTRIRADIFVAGSVATVLGFAVIPAIEAITRRQMEDLQRECEVEVEGRSGGVPLDDPDESRESRGTDQS
jgi:hypothetical protein